ncbi:MAG: hypothetical protein FD138_1228 [Planctomycetota bacterium]|nr:MAG: hypothetical protein FD138_1228 [Planctomycetota bacterium]
MNGLGLQSLTRMTRTSVGKPLASRLGKLRRMYRMSCFSRPAQTLMRIGKSVLSRVTVIERISDPVLASRYICGCWNLGHRITESNFGSAHSAERSSSVRPADAER